MKDAALLLLAACVLFFGAAAGCLLADWLLRRGRRNGSIPRPPNPETLEQEFARINRSAR